VFEHPGLLETRRPARPEVCVTCADQACVAEVQRVLDQHAADVLIGGHPETVDIALVGDNHPRDLLLVHAGVAITTLDP
jgi:hydrogenase maturation factor